MVWDGVTEKCGARISFRRDTRLVPFLILFSWSPQGSVPTSTRNSFLSTIAAEQILTQEDCLFCLQLQATSGAVRTWWLFLWLRSKTETRACQKHSQELFAPLFYLHTCTGEQPPPSPCYSHCFWYCWLSGLQARIAGSWWTSHPPTQPGPSPQGCSQTLLHPAPSSHLSFLCVHSLVHAIIHCTKS